jgi:hypothetical protein
LEKKCVHLIQLFFSNSTLKTDPNRALPSRESRHWKLFAIIYFGLIVLFGFLREVRATRESREAIVSAPWLAKVTSQISAKRHTDCPRDSCADNFKPVDTSTDWAVENVRDGRLKRDYRQSKANPASDDLGQMGCGFSW